MIKTLFKTLTFADYNSNPDIFDDKIHIGYPTVLRCQADKKYLDNKMGQPGNGFRSYTDSYNR